MPAKRPELKNGFSSHQDCPITKEVLDGESDIVECGNNLSVNFFPQPGFFSPHQDGKKEKPVVIHRAVFGSFERFIGILVENYQGAFPVWLSPVQVKVLNLTDRNEKYAKKISDELISQGIRTEIDNANETIGKKIRNAELEKIPYILVIGDKEEKSGAVAVRERGKGNLGAEKIEKFKSRILSEINKKSS